MRFSGSQFTLFLVDGYNLAASLSSSATVSKESITEATNPFGITSEGNAPLNIEKTTITMGQGFFDTAADAIHTAIGGFSKVLRIVVLAFEDNIIGRHFLGLQGVYDQKYDVMDKTTALVMADATYIVSGDANEGVIVQLLQTYSASWDTKTGGGGAAPHTPVDFTLDVQNRAMDIASASIANPTLVTMKTQHGNPIAHGLTTGQKVLFSGTNSTPSLNGTQTVTVVSPTTFTVPVNVTVAATAGSFVLVNSNAGGVGYLQVTAYTGSTGFIDKLMHSADDITYAALITFTDLGSVHTQARERIAVAGFVDRYLSNQGNLTGAGSVTAFAGFSRN